MATTYNPGGQSPTSFSKTLDRVFDDAQHTGEVNLSGRKLKEYPKISAKYDLVDSIGTDLSRNRFSEIPQDVCDYASLERLNCYNNVIKSIPEALIQLHTLTHLNLSRNLLSNIPPFISQVPVLEVLIAANNRLVSLPEEIGKLERLMHLDVSCNEISHLPPQMGDLESLRILNVRRNLLVEIPVEICRLKLRRLDISENKISTIPTIFRKMDTLEEILLDHNPLISPPAHVCTKGRVHILKYLQIEAIKEDRKMGVLSDTDMRRHVRKSLPQSAVSADGIKDLVDKAVSADGRWKRHTVVGSDSGYSSNSIADSINEKPSWNQTEVINNDRIDDENSLTFKGGDAMRDDHQARHRGSGTGSVAMPHRRLALDARYHRHPGEAYHSSLGRIAEPPNSAPTSPNNTISPSPQQSYSAPSQQYPYSDQYNQSQHNNPYFSSKLVENNDNSLPKYSHTAPPSPQATPNHLTYQHVRYNGYHPVHDSPVSRRSPSPASTQSHTPSPTHHHIPPDPTSQTNYQRLQHIQNGPYVQSPPSQRYDQYNTAVIQQSTDMSRAGQQHYLYSDRQPVSAQQISPLIQQMSQQQQQQEYPSHQTQQISPAHQARGLTPPPLPQYPPRTSPYSGSMAAAPNYTTIIPVNQSPASSYRGSPTPSLTSHHSSYRASPTPSLTTSHSPSMIASNQPQSYPSSPCSPSYSSDPNYTYDHAQQQQWLSQSDSSPSAITHPQDYSLVSAPQSVSVMPLSMGSYASIPPSLATSYEEPEPEMSHHPLNDEDEFTRELQRQKAEYERRKKLAEQIRLQHEEVEEREERRRAAVRLQEEQQRVLSEQKQRDNDARLREAAEDLARQREAEVARQREAEEAARQREADVIRQQADIAKQQEAEQARQIEETRKAAAELKAHGRGQPVARETISGRREIPVQHKTTSKDQDVAAKTTRPENKRVAAISRITPSHMTKRKVTTNMTSNAREEKRALSTAAPYHRTSSDSAKNIRSYQTTNGLTENGVGHEKSPSPATSPASSIGSSPRSSTSSLSNVSKTSTTNAPTVRRVQIEDRRGTSVNSTSSVSGTQSPATRRTRLAGGISSSSSSTTTTSATSSVGGRGRGTTTTTGLSTISSMNRTRPGFSATTTSTGRTMPLSSRNNLTTEDEYKHRHEALTNQHYIEAQLLRQRLEDGKDVFLKSHKEAMHDFVSQRTANHIDEKSQAQNNMNAMNKSRQALSAGAMKMLQEYRESDPNFTIRRREELIRDEADQTQRLRQTIETRLKVTLPDNLPEALRDGVVLCHLANQIRPRSVASIHVPSPAVPKLTMAKCRRNVDNFLEACRKIGINQNQICTAHDILEERGLTRISLTVTALTGITAVSPKHQSIV